MYELNVSTCWVCGEGVEGGCTYPVRLFCAWNVCVFVSMRMTPSACV